MTLLQIKYLIAVGKTGNVSKAANDMFVSRTTISRALRELEEEIGVPLFYRTNSGLVLTEEGKFFYERCADIQSSLDVLQAQMCIIREKMMPSRHRIVKLGITPATSVIVFPKLIQALQEENLDIELVTMEYSRIQSRTSLEEGTMDFHLSADARLGHLPESFRKIELINTELALCVSANHRLAKLSSVKVEDYKDEPLIYLAKYFQSESWIEERFAEKGLTPNVRFRSIQLSTIKELTAVGLGCAILMRGSIDDGKNIIALPFDPPIPTSIALVWNSAVPHNQAFDDFLKFVRRYKQRLEKERK